MKKKGMHSGLQAAEAAGIPKSTFYRYLRRPESIKPENVMRFKTTFGVDPLEYVKGGKR